jgi:hypothetical protein
MTEKHKSEEEDESDDSLTISLGIVKMRLTGKMLGTFLPYTGWALIILSVAYAVTVVWNSLK